MRSATLFEYTEMRGITRSANPQRTIAHRREDLSAQR